MMRIMLTVLKWVITTIKSQLAYGKMQIHISWQTYIMFFGTTLSVNDTIPMNDVKNGLT